MRRVVRKNTIQKDYSFKQVVTRMRESNLKANASIDTYVHYSEQLKKRSRQPHLVIDLINEMLDNNIFPNTVILNQLIKLISQCQQLQSALDVHKIAVTKGLASVVSYNSALDAIAKSAQPDAMVALDLLKEAKQAKLANAITYATTVDVIAKSAQPEKAIALSLLEEAKQAGFANTITYNSTITTIARTANPDIVTALRLLDEAKQAGLANTITYNSILDVISKSPQRVQR